MSFNNLENYINSISLKDVTTNLGIALPFLVGSYFSTAYAQDKLSDDKKDNKTKKIEINYPIIDSLIQKLPGDIVHRECIEKITIVPDSTMLKLLNKKNKTENEKKTLRDYLMQTPNSIIIAGRVLGVDPVKSIVPGETYLLNLSSENKSNIELVEADKLLYTLKKSKDLSLADKRLLEQIMNTTYNRFLPQTIKETIQQSVNDQVLFPEETMNIASLLQKNNLPGVLVGLVNKHEGGTYKGKKVKGESVPYFIYFTSKIEKIETIKENTDTVYVPSIDSTKIDNTKNGKRIEDKKVQITKKDESNNFGLMFAAGAVYDGDNKIIMPQLSAGINFNDKLNLNISASYWQWSDGLDNINFEGPFGYTKIHDRNIDFKKIILESSVIYGSKLKLGAGISHNYFSSKQSESFDELVRDHNGNTTRERTNQKLPEILSEKQYISYGPRLSYDFSHVNIMLGSDFAKNHKPNYLLRLSFRK